MRNEQKNNNAYLASILTMLLLASSIPLLNTAQAEDLSDNVTFSGDAQGNSSFASFNGTASYTIEVTSNSDISLVMGLRYIENSTLENIEFWSTDSATFIYAGTISTSNFTLDAGPGTYAITVSIEVPSNSEQEDSEGNKFHPFIADPDSFEARFGFCSPAPCDYTDMNSNDFFVRFGYLEVRDWVVLSDNSDIGYIDAGGSESLDHLVLKNLLRDESGDIIQLSKMVIITTDSLSIDGIGTTSFDISDFDCDCVVTEAVLQGGAGRIWVSDLGEEEITLPLVVTFSPTTSVVYCPSTPSVISFHAADNSPWEQTGMGPGPVPLVGITANPYSLVSFSSDSISQVADTWDGEGYAEAVVNFDIALGNGGNIYDSFDVSLTLDSNFPQDWSIVANLDDVAEDLTGDGKIDDDDYEDADGNPLINPPFNDDISQVHRTEELEYLNAASRPCNSLYWESDADRDSLNLAIKITIPANSQADFTSGATISATSIFDGTVSSEQHFSVSVAQHYAVDVAATSITTVETDPESTAQFDFTVTNTGNGEDVFNIHSTASSDWNPSLSTSMITLGVNEVYTGHMIMTVPEGMMFGDSSGAVKISAQSEGDPADEFDDEDNDGVWDQGLEQLTVDHNGNSVYDSGTHDSVSVQVQVSQVHDVEFNYYVNESKVMITTIEIYTDTISFININATNMGNGNDQIRFELTSFSTENAGNWLEIVQDVEYMSPGDSVTVSIKASPYLTTTPDTYTFTVTAMSYGTIKSGESQILTIVVKQRETLPDGGQVIEDIDEGGLLGIPGFELVGALLSLTALSIARRPKI